MATNGNKNGNPDTAPTTIPRATSNTNPQHPDAGFAKKTYGFAQIPERKDLLDEAKRLAKQLGEYETLGVIGIGGSSVGTEALWKIFAPAMPSKNIFFFDNVDFVDTNRKLDGLTLAKTAWFIVSKSGSTLETLTLTERISEIYREAGLAFHSRCAVCTEKVKNPLSDWAEKNKIPQLEIPVNVGGRFSVLTPVGIFPLAFAGVNVDKLMKGAERALSCTEDIHLMATKCCESFEKHPITVFWFYSSVAKSFGAWIQQLWAESLGKKLNRAGQAAKTASTPLFAVGANDQHSILQQIAEGPRDKFVIFFRAQDLETFSHKLSIQEFPFLSYLNGKAAGEPLRASAEGTEQSLKNAGILTHRIYYPDHSPETFGYLVMWFELLVAQIGEMLDINTFDQPGVEASKIISKGILQGK